jgi:hypothetical protein
MDKHHADKMTIRRLTILTDRDYHNGIVSYIRISIQIHITYLFSEF